MKDNEIIKAVKLCVENDYFERNCHECPYNDDLARCMDNLMFDVIDLINRQKAEIERYKERCSKCCEKTTKTILNLQELLAEQKAEIERLKEFEYMYNDLCE